MSLLITDFLNQSSPNTPTEFVRMTWAERRQPRRKYVTDKGHEVALALPRGTVLKDGSIIHIGEGRVIAVKAELESVIVIRPTDQRQACIAAHHMGNWHRSMQITSDGDLLVEEDTPMCDRMTKIGIAFTREKRIFQPDLTSAEHA